MAVIAADASTGAADTPAAGAADTDTAGTGAVDEIAAGGIAGLTPGQTLVAACRIAAAEVLARPGFADKNIDATTFAAKRRSELVQLIGGQAALRASIRAQLPHAQAAHPLLARLLGEDKTAAQTAAVRLATDTTALNPAPAARPTPAAAAVGANGASASSGGGTASGEARPPGLTEVQLVRHQRKVDDLRAARDQARAQKAHLEAELADARAQMKTLESDLNEAGQSAAALTRELDAARHRERDLRSDVMAAAALLLNAASPEPVDTLARDPRENDRREPGEAPADADGSRLDAPPQNEDLAAALERAGVPVAMLREALTQLLNPPRRVSESPADLHLHERDMAVTPLGGGTQIGGSCILVEVGQIRLLIDCGTRPKRRVDDCAPPLLDEALSGDIDGVVITHAHADHAGYIPALIARYPHLRLWCTADTAALLPRMWRDSAKVMADTSAELVEPGEPAATPPYGQLQVEAAIERLIALPFGQEREVGDGVGIELFPAGHILGAAGVVVIAGSTRVVVTGDVSHPKQQQRSVHGLELCESARGSDLFLIESTYCHEEGTPRVHEVANFVERVESTINGGGRVLVPAFALGRAQEVVLTIRAELPGVPVLVDGMARDICDIYQRQTEDTAHPLALIGGDVRRVTPGQRRQMYQRMPRGVIVTTSGMLSSGPAKQWAEWILPDPKAALLISGYQDGESTGADLLRLIEGTESERTFMIDRKPVTVEATVKKFALSAHAAKLELASIVKDASPREVMLVHGLESRQRHFARHLTQLGHRVARTERWQS